MKKKCTHITCGQCRLNSAGHSINSCAHSQVIHFLIFLSDRIFGMNASNINITSCDRFFSFGFLLFFLLFALFRLTFQIFYREFQVEQMLYNQLINQSNSLNKFSSHISSKYPPKTQFAMVYAVHTYFPWLTFC